METLHSPWVIADWGVANRHANRDMMLLSSPYRDENSSLPTGQSCWPPSAWLAGGGPRSGLSALPCATGPRQGIPAISVQSLEGNGKTTDMISHSLNNTSSLFLFQLPDKHFFLPVFLFI